MASPNMKKLNDSIPRPTMVDKVEGNVNTLKEMQRHNKRISKGRTFLDITKTKGAFGNRPNKTIPLGYDFKFPKKSMTKEKKSLEEQAYDILNKACLGWREVRHLLAVVSMEENLWNSILKQL